MTLSPTLAISNISTAWEDQKILTLLNQLAFSHPRAAGASWYLSIRGKQGLKISENQNFSFALSYETLAAANGKFSAFIGVLLGFGMKQHKEDNQSAMKPNGQPNPSEIYIWGEENKFEGS